MFAKMQEAARTMALYDHDAHPGKQSRARNVEYCFRLLKLTRQMGLKQRCVGAEHVNTRRLWLLPPGWFEPI
jgi:hypothetical protein